MDNIKSIGSITSDKNKQYLVGWDIEKQKVYISAVNAWEVNNWANIFKLAKTEEEAISLAKIFIDEN